MCVGTGWRDARTVAIVPPSILEKCRHIADSAMLNIRAIASGLFLSLGSAFGLGLVTGPWPEHFDPVIVDLAEARCAGGCFRLEEVERAEGMSRPSLGPDGTLDDLIDVEGVLVDFEDRVLAVTPEGATVLDRRSGESVRRIEFSQDIGPIHSASWESDNALLVYSQFHADHGHLMYHSPSDNGPHRTLPTIPRPPFVTSRDAQVLGASIGRGHWVAHPDRGEFFRWDAEDLTIHPHVRIRGWGDRRLHSVSEWDDSRVLLVAGGANRGLTLVLIDHEIGYIHAVESVSGERPVLVNGRALALTGPDGTMRSYRVQETEP